MSGRDFVDELLEEIPESAWEVISTASQRIRPGELVVQSLRHAERRRIVQAVAIAIANTPVSDVD